MNLLLNTARRVVLNPTDTHCATGETCMNVKYCPKGDVLDENNKCNKPK